MITPKMSSVRHIRARLVPDERIAVYSLDLPEDGHREHARQHHADRQRVVEVGRGDVEVELEDAQDGRFVVDEVVHVVDEIDEDEDPEERDQAVEQCA